ncbi:MAG: tryptophan synthase subunit alpha [Phycisphaerales bacterium]|nr:tryptophan synthase subunit alpha [Phycisphaerales bacterium]
MSRIDDIFESHRREGTRALMPFLTGGYPSLPDTERALLGMADAGASIVEIGFPFSDPIADGPVIASSMHETLERGLRIEQLFAMVAGVRDRTTLGLVAMTSDSILERMGTERFFARAAEAGFDGLIVPDMDLSKARGLGDLARQHDLALTFLIAPTTAPDRAAEILDACRGFVYLLARTGLTGEQQDAPEIERQVEMIRSRSSLPIAAGFGIATPEHVRMVTAHADAAIVGSALVRRMGLADDPASAALEFTRELASGLAGATPTSSPPR